MKKIALALFAVCALGIATVANAASFSIGGDVGDFAPGHTGGVLEVNWDAMGSGINFANGGVRLALTNDNPSLLKITGVQVENPSGRWTAVNASPVTDSAAPSFEGFSILTQGLPSPAVFARVQYDIVGGAFGTANLSLAPEGLDPLFDGEIGDVSGQVTLNGAAVTIIPEPATMALAGLSLVGLVLRRRNG